MIKDQLSNYSGFLETLLEADYSFVFFDSVLDHGGKRVALRHDIDFDTGYALNAAEAEKELGIQSTYFFLLRSEFYNVLSPENYDNISRIRDLGHKISIHFDPTIYEDYNEGLLREIQYFDAVFGEKVDLISLHRPNDFFLKSNESIHGVEHTYLFKYFKELKYFADSKGQWRYGHPFDSEEFKRRESLQILVHPIWWFFGNHSVEDKLRKYWDIRTESLKTEFEINCIPFREIFSQP